MKWVLWMVTMPPFRTKGCMCEVNRGARRVRDSKNVGSIREVQLGGHKHKTVLAIRGEKPPSVFSMVIGIGYRLADVQRSKIPDPYRIVV